MSVTVADIRAKFSADTGEFEKGVSRASKSVDSLGNTLDKLSDNARRAGKDTAGAFSGFGSTLDGFAGQAQASFQRFSEYLGGNLISAGIEKLTSGIVDATQKMVEFGTVAVQEANEFNAKFADIASLDVPIEHVEKFKEAINDLSVKYGKDANDMATGTYQIISAFGDGPDVVKDLEVNTRLAVGGLSTLKEAVNLTSAVTRNWGDTSAEAQAHVSDLALLAVQQGQTTLPELAASIGSVSNLGHDLGLTQEELFASGTTLAGVVGSTSQGFTDLRSVMVGIEKPTENATKLMNAMGFSSGKAMIQQYGFEGALQIFKAAADKAGISLFDLFGRQEAVAAITALAGSQSKKYAENLTAMQNATGKTDRAVQQQMNGMNKLGTKLNQATQWWHRFQRESGDAIGNALLAFEAPLEPYLTQWGAQLEAFLPTIETWAQETKAKMQQAFDTAGGGINGAVAALGKVTGADVTINAKTKITDVDWGKFNYTYKADAGVYSIDWVGKAGTTTYSYNATAGIFSIDWVSKLGPKSSFLYDASAGIIDVDWQYTNGGYRFLYDANAGIQDVQWNSEGFTFQYDAKAGVTEVYFGEGLFAGQYSATASVTNVLWGALTHTYNASTTIAETNVLWGGWTHMYNASATINEQSVGWGLWGHKYNASVGIEQNSVYWGAWTHSYSSNVQIGKSDILWGAWTTTYDAKAKIMQDSILWGTWTHSYDVGAKVQEQGIVWGTFSHIYDAAVRIKEFITGEGPAKSVGNSGGGGSGGFGGLDDLGRAKGDANFRGGLALVGEKGPELAIFPPHTQILSNANTGKFFGGIPHFAEGTVNLPPMNASQLAGFNKGVAALMVSNDKTAKANERAANKMAKTFEQTVNKFQSTIEGMLGKVPGLFAPSPVTEQDMALSQAGLYQDHVDEVLRRVQSAAVNDKDQSRFADDIAKAKEALNRIGVSASDNIKVMAEQFKQAWSDQSLFSNKANLSLLNMDAVKRSFQLQQQQAAGKANILQLFGIQPDQAQQQAMAAGVQIAGYLANGASSVNQATYATNLINKMAAGFTPAAVAPASAALTSGIAANLAGGSDKEGKQAGVDYGSQIATALGTSLAQSPALATAGQSVLQAITDSWKDLSNVDFIGGLANGITTQLGTTGAISALKDVGGKIAAILKQGIDAWFKDANIADSIRSAVPSAAPAATPGFALGTSYAPGGFALVGERGPELAWIPRGSQITPARPTRQILAQQAQQQEPQQPVVVNNTYYVDSKLDIHDVARKVADVIRRKAGK